MLAYLAMPQYIQLTFILQSINFLFEKPDCVLQLLRVAIPILVLLHLLQRGKVQCRHTELQRLVLLLGHLETFLLG